MTRVLIADDHEVVRRGLKQILADEFSPVKVFEAQNSQETLQQVNEQTFDLHRRSTSLGVRTASLPHTFR